MSTTLYQFELDQRKIDCGMSYAFHLADGRFFLIDGGYFTPGEEDRLYQFLTEHSAGKPVIAGWYFSHAHQDHIGNFIQFLWKYQEQVTIQQLIFNFQPVDTSGVTGDWKSCDEATLKEFYHTLETYCEDIPVITPHTGDRFAIGELEIEILYTQEDLYPTPAAFNDYSTVIATTVAGQRILWLGDIEIQGSRILLEQKRDRLPSDILQIAHHGFNGATIELYQAIAPKVCLWPSPARNMEENRSTPVNHYVLNDLGVQEHIVSGQGSAKFMLPYQPGTCERYPKVFF